MAKVMTAYVALKHYPLRAGDSGPQFVVAQDDVVDTETRRREGQSIVDVRAGERLTERDALMAILLPSANNVSVLVARQKLDERDRAIANAVRAGARLDEIAEAASITRAAASLAARRTLAARPGRGGPYARRRATSHALNAVSYAAHELAEAREQSHRSKDFRDKAIAAAVANCAGVSETARAVGMTPASISVIARASIRGDAKTSRPGAVASP